MRNSTAALPFRLALVAVLAGHVQTVAGRFQLELSGRGLREILDEIVEGAGRCR